VHQHVAPRLILRFRGHPPTHCGRDSHHRTGGVGADLHARVWRGPSRHQAGEHPAQPRPGDSGGLRDRQSWTPWMPGFRRSTALYCIWPAAMTRP